MLHADMPMGHTLGWEAFLCLNYSVNVSGLNKHSFEMVRGANAPPPPPKKLWKTFRMIELLLKSTLKTSLSLEVKYKICGGSTPKTSSCFTSCLWNHKLVWVYVKVFGEKSHNTWEFISKTDSSLDKIDRKYILKKSILHCLLYMF